MKKFLYVLIVNMVCFASSFSYEKSNNIVTDTQNKLMWQDDAEVIQYLETYVGAKTYCDILVLNGYIDWRVPSIKELQNIIDVSVKESIEKSFIFVQPNIYTTKTVFKENTKQVWAVDFKSGKTLFVDKSQKNYVRCVRDVK